MKKQEQITMEEMMPDDKNWTTNEVEEQGTNDYIYRFEEMKDAMEASINNLDRVKEQQAKLIELVENSEQKEFFNEFLEDSKKQQENFDKQREALQIKISLLATLLERCHNDSNAAEIVSMLSEILGLFKN